MALVPPCLNISQTPASYFSPAPFSFPTYTHIPSLASKVVRILLQHGQVSLAFTLLRFGISLDQTLQTSPVGIQHPKGIPVSHSFRAPNQTTALSARRRISRISNIFLHISSIRKHEVLHCYLRRPRRCCFSSASSWPTPTSPCRP